MNCACCGSDRLIHRLINTREYAQCHRCGFMGTESSTERHIVSHYRDHDPHEKVADSKRPFFNAALSHLSKQHHDSNRRILDIGCGFGYFLEYAARQGWNPYGVEIVEDAVLAARKRLGSDQIFHGSLQNAHYPSEMFHAITVWDVLVHMADPLGELKECCRILKPGASIGIRVRNAEFQQSLYAMYRFAQPIAKKAGIKNPFVFHTNCFTPKSLTYLLGHAGFERIRIQNSPLSKGDPYEYTPLSWLTASAKAVIHVLSEGLFSMSGGRWVVGPSLLVWAQKPKCHLD